jgi:Holliday junction resolvase RusA-like endonuclease
MDLVIYGDPRTKKNSQRLVRVGLRTIPIVSKAYEQYEDDFIRQVTGDKKRKVNFPVNVRCLYYMRTHRKVDLVNLLEATNDLLVGAEVLQDDNSSIVVGHDGSRVMYDRSNPRVEIEITEVWE